MTNPNEVTIVPNENGQTIRQSKTNPEFGHIRVSQKRVLITNGWVKNQEISALIQGKMEDLRASGMGQMKTLPGKIVVVEQLKPFGDDPQRNIKVAGDTGVILKKDGLPIYRNTFFTSDLSATDTLIAHDNSEEIKNANSVGSAAAVANTSFDDEVSEENKVTTLEEDDDDMNFEIE